MKLQTRNNSAGNTLFITLFLTALMGISLGSYLLLVQYQNQSVMRSISWNSCIPMSEAGIEEAMTHINMSGLTNLASAGWTSGASGYTRTRYLGDSYYNVTISATDPPVVTSQGYVPLPSGAFPLGFIATQGIGATNRYYSGRTVQVTTLKDGLWAKAMVAKKTINLNGNNIATDSFDSGNSLYSTGGLYDATKHRANGDVATNSRIINSLSIGNANIYGHASTGPGGTIATGPNGGVGDFAWQASHTGIEPGWSSDDMNVYFPDVKQPYTSGFTPSSGSIGGNSYTYLLTGGDYIMSDLSLTGNNSMMVTNKCRLIVTSSINIKGNAYIQIAAGASLQLYMAGASAAIGGNGFVNGNGNAMSCIYIGLPTHTSLSFQGNGAFTGVVYAPEADFSLGGGGSNTQDFIGSSVSNTVTMNGHFHFHYDEALGRNGWARGYLVNSWNEL